MSKKTFLEKINIQNTTGLFILGLSSIVGVSLFKKLNLFNDTKKDVVSYWDDMQSKARGLISSNGVKDTLNINDLQNQINKSIKPSTTDIFSYKPTGATITSNNEILNLSKKSQINKLIENSGIKTDFQNEFFNVSEVTGTTKTEITKGSNFNYLPNISEATITKKKKEVIGTKEFKTEDIKRLINQNLSATTKKEDAIKSGGVL